MSTFCKTKWLGNFWHITENVLRVMCALTPLTQKQHCAVVFLGKKRLLDHCSLIFGTPDKIVLSLEESTEGEVVVKSFGIIHEESASI